jgi:hypothetical protein
MAAAARPTGASRARRAAAASSSQAGARAGEGQAGEQGEPDQHRRRGEQHLALDQDLGARPPHRPPTPGEDRRQRHPQIEGEVVGVDEGAAQALGAARHLGAPDLARAREPAARAVEHLEQGGRDRGGHQEAALPAVAADQGGGGERRGGGRPGEGRAARDRGGERQAGGGGAA